ncbi:adaptor protein MecA [Paenisporosarcina sp. TG-14]|uniref:adaptor protein MecA n=1 Tax=Paenisporosarcina sp. TG-14 TaxID=1231057 RepID=UPI0002D692FF|nr:adaptor protein MecA [Paenisporosarcina sp. TG-14]
MDIERINENTVKFYISYIDIEKRGFSRDEIWFNRDKSEELFWEMMDEINDESDFEVEGPLWIQVHAMEKGLEVTVTRAEINRDGKKLESPFEVDEKGQYFSNMSESSSEERSFDEFTDPFTDSNELQNEFTFQVSDFEDLIPLAKRVKLPSYVATSLFAYKERYYLYVKADAELMDEEEVKNMVSMISEYTAKSSITVHRLEEYGKEIMADEVFEQIQKYFS